MFNILSNRIVQISAVLAVLFSVGIMAASYMTHRDDSRIFSVNLSRVNLNITPLELANWYISNKRDFEVLDLRSPESYNRGHIKNAMSCPVCHENRGQAMEQIKTGELQMPNFNKKIVIYTQTGKEQISLPRILSQHKKLYHLEGGYDAWESDIINPGMYPEQMKIQDKEQRDKIFAISNYFLGKTVQPPPSTIDVKVKKKVHIMRSFANEGC